MVYGDFPSPSWCPSTSSIPEPPSSGKRRSFRGRHPTTSYLWIPSITPSLSLQLNSLQAAARPGHVPCKLTSVNPCVALPRGCAGWLRTYTSTDCRQTRWCSARLQILRSYSGRHQTISLDADRVSSLSVRPKRPPSAATTSYTDQAQTH